MSPQARAVADRAYAHLVQAGEDGDWQPLLGMLADEFEFLFPAGPFRGHHFGPEGKQRFLAWAAHKHASRSVRTLEQALYTGDWAIYALRSVGRDAAGEFDTVVAVWFRVDGERISGFREYIGDLAAWV